MRSIVFSVGLLVGIASAAPPQVVINEILCDPLASSDSKGEWFELYNRADSTLDLNGWLLRDGGRDLHTIASDSSLLIAPGGFLVLGRSADSTANGGYVPDYVYASFVLSNEEDEIVLVSDSGEVVDSVGYGADWPSSQGASLELMSPLDDNADPANWGLAVVPFGVGDLGTPGGWNSIAGSGVDGEDERAGGVGDPPGGIFCTFPYPNPSRDGFRIGVSIPSGGSADYDLEIFDVRGRRVRKISSCCLGAGGTTLRWEGRTDSGEAAPAGIYFYRVRAEGKEATGKLMVVK
jgi:hypothetical protein